METKTPEIINYFLAVWKRKWLVTAVVAAACLVGFVLTVLSPKVWQVECLLQPAKFFVWYDTGEYKEVVVVDGLQMANQINEGSYNETIAAELKIPVERFPWLAATNIPNTKLVKVAVKNTDVDTAKAILTSLFAMIKKDQDRKVDAQVRALDIQIENNKNQLELKRLTFTDKQNAILLKENEIKTLEIDLTLSEIEKSRIRGEIASVGNKQKISEERIKGLVGDIEIAGKRVADLEERQKAALADKGAESNTMSALLYANEVMNNIRFLNTLGDRLSTEKITEEDLASNKNRRGEDLRQTDQNAEKVKANVLKMRIQANEIRNEIEKIKNEMVTIENTNRLLLEQKSLVDPTQLIKAPTSSINPVSPNLGLSLLVAFILGLVVAVFLALFLEYLSPREAR